MKHSIAFYARTCDPDLFSAYKECLNRRQMNQVGKVGLVPIVSCLYKLYASS